LPECAPAVARLVSHRFGREDSGESPGDDARREANAVDDRRRLSHQVGKISRIAVGTWVMANLYRNPTMTAKIVETLDEIAGGRFVFGIGAGSGGGGEAEAFGFSARPRL
jgi:hypothetical protein